MTKHEESYDYPLSERDVGMNQNLKYLRLTKNYHQDRGHSHTTQLKREIGIVWTVDTPIEVRMCRSLLRSSENG